VVNRTDKIFWVTKIAIVLVMGVNANSVLATSLPELIIDAVNTHPVVRSRLAQVKSSEAGIDTARWQFYPTPSISVEAVNASQSDLGFQGDDYVATARITQPLWTAGGLTAGLQKAKANFSVSDANFEASRQSIALRVVEAYGEWLSAHLKGKAWEASLVVHRELRDRVQRRVKEGVSGGSDLSLAEGRFESIRADVVTAKVQEEIALSRLAQLVGHPLIIKELSSNVAIAIPVGLVSLEDLKREAKSISPELHRVKAQLNLAKAETQESKSEFWPELYMRLERQEGSYTYQDVSAETRIYVGFNSRFGAGLSNFSKEKASRIRVDAVLADIEAQNRTIEEQIISDYALLNSFESRVKSLEISLKIAYEVSDSYGRQFLAGRKTWLDVMNVVRDLVGAEVQLADAIASQLSVSWRLSIVSQGVLSTVQASSNQ